MKESFIEKYSRMQDEYIWAEKYRPTEINECILPEHLKKTLQDMVDSGTIQNLILVGTKGIGKTSVARALLQELDADFIFINASLNGSIDTIRNDIANFASSVSFTGKRKYVILDEAERISAAGQDGLKGFLEEFSSNCSFIFTCNNVKNIIEPLHSRTTIIEFKILPEERAQLALKFSKRVKDILEANNVKYDFATVCTVINKFFPDWRRVLNELQKYSVSGSIDSGILARIRDTSIDDLIGYMKKKDFKSVRKWAVEQNSDAASIFRQFYDEAEEILQENSIPQLVLHIAKYQESAAIVADQEINLVAFLTECMIDIVWK